MISQVDSMPAPTEVVDALLRLLRLIQSVPAEFIGTAQEDPAGASDDAVLDEITGWLYANWYTEHPSQRTTAPFPGRANLASALSVTVASSGVWESGWITLQSAPNGECVASNRDVTRHLLPGQYANIARPGIAPQPGDGLAVCTLVDWVDERTGFWHVQSSAGEPALPLMRVYWNVDWPHAGYVLNRLTSVLDDAGIRYALKCPFRAADYHRVDTIVVYIERAMWEQATPAIARVANEVEHQLRAATPPMTRPIGPGVAWSEDPGSSTSFGESRCRALAPAVRSIVRDSAAWTDDTALHALVQSLRDATIDPRRPWLVAPSAS